MNDLPKFSTDDPELKPFVNGLNRAVKAILDRTPLKGSDCEIDYIPGKGFRPKPKGKGDGSGGNTVVASPLHLAPRGEWHSSLDYNAFDMVVIVGGTNAGTYYATEPAPVGTPEPGTGGATAWVKFGGDFNTSSWR